MKEEIVRIRIEKTLKDKAMRKAKENKDFSSFSEWVRDLIRNALRRNK